MRGMKDSKLSQNFPFSVIKSLEWQIYTESYSFSLSKTFFSFYSIWLLLQVKQQKMMYEVKTLT